MNPIVAVRKSKELDGRVITRHYYWCPGCDSLHGIAIRLDVQDNGASWMFTGSLERPTYSPSQLSTGSNRCHTFIRDGIIEFLEDCSHSMKGQKVPMVPLPDWFVKEKD